MLFCLAICIISAVQIESFVLQGSYNIHLKDSVRYEIDESIRESDYEMVDGDSSLKLEVGDKENIFYELNKLASKEYDKSLKSPKDWFTDRVHVISTVTKAGIDMTTTRKTPLTVHVFKREFSKNRIKKIHYDYDYLINEYYEESVDEAKSKNTYHARKVGSSETGLVHSLKRVASIDIRSNCSEEKFGLPFINCVLTDYKDRRQSPLALVLMVWKMVKIWLLVYLVVAVPLWCTRGWCCCCLCCATCKPRRTIDEAKKYLILNPPGVLTARGGFETRYEPTEMEKEHYEEFEHLVRTI